MFPPGMMPPGATPGQMPPNPLAALQKLDEAGKNLKEAAARIEGLLGQMVAAQRETLELLKVMTQTQDEPAAVSEPPKAS